MDRLFTGINGAIAIVSCDIEFDNNKKIKLINNVVVMYSTTKRLGGENEEFLIKNSITCSYTFDR